MTFLKILKKIFIIFIILLFFTFILSRGQIYKKDELKYGVTFSKKQAQNLNLDWKNLYLNILTDLNVKKIRIPVYWDEVEIENNKYYFDDIDWQINEAQRNNAEIILAIGDRLPRWPECHFPTWTNNLNKTKIETETLSYLQTVVERYKNKNNIVAWQIENEPFLSHFGECPKINKNFLDKEIKFAKELDDRPILITDSGELSTWIPAAKRGDWFGTTMYRDTYSKKFKRYIHYPIKPGFFRFKKNLTNIFASPKKWIVIELQAEPWGPKPYQDLSQSERERTMDLEKFKEIINFSSQTSFNEFYLWGVEWWAWEKEYNNNPNLWEEARKLF